MIGRINDAIDMFFGNSAHSVASFRAAETRQKQVENAQIARLAAITMQSAFENGLQFGEDELLELKHTIHTSTCDLQPGMVNLDGVTHPSVLGLFPGVSIEECR